MLTVPLTSRSPVSLPLLRPPYTLRHNNIKIRPVNDSTMASNCSNERKNPMSLTLNQMLEIELKCLPPSHRHCLVHPVF